MANESMIATGKFDPDRIRKIAEIMAASIKIAERGIEVERSECSEYECRMLDLGKTLADIDASSICREREAVDQAANVIPFRRRIR